MDERGLVFITFLAEAWDKFLEYLQLVLAN
jgi:hypothetical protein